MGDSESYWHRQVHSILPDLEINSLILHQEGFVNDVLIVNDQWVIRFTKTEWGKEQMAVEGQLMRFLQERLPLSIPNPEVTLPGVIVYPYLQGEILRRDIWHQTDKAGRQLYADQLGQFLKALHRMNLDAFTLKVPPTLAPVTKETWEDIYERLVAKVYPHLLPHQTDWVDALFTTTLRSTHFFEFDPVLVHGDLASYHILYSPKEKCIKAVIDFGVAGLGDPATDLGSLINCYGETLVGLMDDVYPDMAEFLPRARFYAQAIELQWALLGVESEDFYWFTAHIGGARDIR